MMIMTISCRCPVLPWDGPGLVPFAGAGFLFHGDVPGGAGSYCPSAGVYPLRPTGGELEQVDGGVQVLGRDRLVIAGQRGRRLVQRVRADAGDPGVNPGEP